MKIGYKIGLFVFCLLTVVLSFEAWVIGGKLLKLSNENLDSHLTSIVQYTSTILDGNAHQQITKNTTIKSEAYVTESTKLNKIADKFDLKYVYT